MRVFRTSILCAPLAIAGGAAAQQPLHLNVEANYAPFRAAATAGDGDVLCLGDSLTFREDSYFPTFKTRMHNRYGDGGDGYQPLSFWTDALLLGDGWTYGRVNADMFPYHGLDGFWSILADNAPGEMWVTCEAARLRLCVLAGPGSGTARITFPEFPGAAPVDIETASGETAVRAIAFEPPPGATRYILRGVWAPPAPQPQPVPPAPRRDDMTVDRAPHPVLSGFGPLTFLGQIRESLQPGVRAHRAANGGWGTVNFLHRDWTFDAMVREIDPNLIVIMLGQNDSGLGLAEYQARLTTIVDRLRSDVPGAGIVLVSSYDSGIPQLAEVSQAMINVATSRGVGFINLYQGGGPRSFYASNGYLHEDGVHFSPAGGRYVANFIYDALESGGASIGAPCNDIDFNNDELAPDNGDIQDFLAVFGGAPCSTEPPAGAGCDRLDFNRDGLFPDNADIESFFRVFGGGSC
ncbi:MAG TPA: GDSL-type esterase/lipase family protein [Phycisphaerales bacterium]|nr:GDSL-type esterase/lipase family protein [Phycisphaerales bacterium]